jgi:hypothetical protein
MMEAVAVRNLILTDPERNEWADWVPTYLDGMARLRDRHAPPTPEPKETR